MQCKLKTGNQPCRSLYKVSAGLETLDLPLELNWWSVCSSRLYSMKTSHKRDMRDVLYLWLHNCLLDNSGRSWWEITPGPMQPWTPCPPQPVCPSPPQSFSALCIQDRRFFLQSTWVWAEGAPPAKQSWPCRTWVCCLATKWSLAAGKNHCISYPL